MTIAINYKSKYMAFTPRNIENTRIYFMAIFLLSCGLAIVTSTSAYNVKCFGHVVYVHYYVILITIFSNWDFETIYAVYWKFLYKAC